ncbi:hypothetical protein SynA1825c_00712 [Synechococcus sp. A18-25c]|nr:hypothetical protein SynA1825c_00712 [Synechococcus sp. A18-25c]
MQPDGAAKDGVFRRSEEKPHLWMLLAGSSFCTAYHGRTALACTESLRLQLCLKVRRFLR